MRRAFPGIHISGLVVRAKGWREGAGGGGLMYQKVCQVGGFWSVSNFIEYCCMDFRFFGGGYCVGCWVLGV